MLQLCLHHQRKPLREKNWRNRNSNQNIQLLGVDLVEEVIRHFFKRKWERDKSILILETTTWPNREVVLDEVQSQCWQNRLERSIPHLTVSQLGRVLSYKALTQEEHLPVILLANLCQIQQWLDYCDCCITSSRPEKKIYILQFYRPRHNSCKKAGNYFFVRVSSYPLFVPSKNIIWPLLIF